MPDVAGDESGWGPVADRVILHPTVGLPRDASSQFFVRVPLSVRLHMSSSYPCLSASRFCGFASLLDLRDPFYRLLQCLHF
jgi:hypothetical protein